MSALRRLSDFGMQARVLTPNGNYGEEADAGKFSFISDGIVEYS